MSGMTQHFIQADQIEKLRRQVEALALRVEQLETKPAPASRKRQKLSEEEVEQAYQAALVRLRSERGSK